MTRRLGGNSGSSTGAGGFDGLLERQVARYQDKPFLTWYDDDHGERVELSYKTFANWLAKTANLLVEELGVKPGEQAALLLPTHWQTVVVRAACWLAGVRALPLPEQAEVSGELEVAAVFVREERLSEVASLVPVVPVVALTADWLGRPAGDLGGVLNFARAVAAMSDDFEVEGEGGLEAGIAIAELSITAAGLVKRLALTDGDRLYTSLPVQRPLGLVTTVLTPLAVGAGVVLEAALPAAPGGFWRRLAAERVTVAFLEPAVVLRLLEAPGPSGDLDLSRLRVAVCLGDTAGAAISGAEDLAGRFERVIGVPLLTDISPTGP